MRTRIISLYGSGSSSADAVAQVIVPRNSIITALNMEVWTETATAAVGRSHWELSFSSARQVTTNDAIGPIACCIFAPNFAANGVYNARSAVQLAGVAIPARGEDRIYLHLGIAGTPGTCACRCFVYLAE